MTKRALKTLILVASLLSSIFCYSQDQVNPEENFDIYQLARLASEYMRETNERPTNLNVLIERDSLNLLTQNFKEISCEYGKRFIEVQFVFTDSRTPTMTQISNAELERMNWIKWSMNKKANTHFNGTIELNYGERFYKIRRITLNEKNGS